MMTPSFKRGFTLVETLVAITVVSLAILAPFDAIERVVNASRLAKDNLIASELAQEGLEYVRFIRTSNYLDGDTLFQGIDNSASTRFGTSNCRNNNYCDLDASVAVGSSVTSCSGGNFKNCRALYVNNNTGLYTYTTTGATPTIFKRGFTYVRNTNSQGIYETVTVQVSWVDHGAQTMTLTENLYDWF